MKNNKVYMPQDAVARHEDFDLWYEDGETFLSFKGDWKSERDKVTIFGRMGGEMGRIKPDPKGLIYYMRIERWEYAFHTLHVFKRYCVEGMQWDVEGGLANPPLDFVHEDDGVKDVHVQLVNFKGHGPCYEIRVRDVAKLRVAAAAVVAMAVKEEYRGLSEGVGNPDATRLEKAKNWLLSGKGKTYEELLANESE